MTIQQKTTVAPGNTRTPFLSMFWIRSKAAIVARIADFFCRLCMKSHRLSALAFIPFSDKLRSFIGRQRLVHQYFRAKRHTPAYRGFVRSSTCDVSSIERFIRSIPVTDKEHYIKPNLLGDCCMHGVVPNGCVIDESSGSTGTPTNWARGRSERDYNQRVIRYSISQMIGASKQMIINSFALGPWATGMNISSAFEKHSILKSLGPDIDKIINTLSTFGTSYHYVIMGYPPFLKKLADTELIDWKAYAVTFIFGGESISEYTREYIRTRGIGRIYGSYGASDLELNMAAENDFTISLRKLLSRNKQLASALLIDQSVLPMVFQYNPADFYMESTPGHELVISLCRPGYVMPKIRYNIHDTGHTMTMAALRAALVKQGIDLSVLDFPKHDYPLLFHYGRSDMSVSFYGSKLCPQQVHDVIMMRKELNLAVNNFFIRTREDAACNKKLELHFELKENLEPDELQQRSLADLVIKNLCIVNQDFRESLRIVGEGNYPLICFRPYRDQAFKTNDFRIKNKYIIN